MKRHSPLILFALLLAALPAIAQPQSNYLDVNALFATQPVKWSPADNSSQTAAELAELHRLHDTSSPTEVAQANADDKEASVKLFRTLFGPAFADGSSQWSATVTFFTRLDADGSTVVNMVKDIFRRPRPGVRDTTLQMNCSTPTGFSYPSGHAIQGYLAGMALVAMLPQRANEIMKRADEFGHNRLVCGVHYASDVAASKVLAAKTLKVMRKNHDFHQDFEAARREVRRNLAGRN